MGTVDKVDRTLALNEMMYHVRRDAALRRRFVDDLDGSEGNISTLRRRSRRAWPPSP